MSPDCNVALDRHQNDVILASWRSTSRASQDLQAAAAALGDEAVTDGFRRLSDAVEPSLRLRIIDLLAEVTLSSTCSSTTATSRCDRRTRPELVVRRRASGRGRPPAPGDDLSARITLRLPEGLKTSIEAAAAREGISANAWIVRALARALEPRAARRSSNRLQGFARS